MARRTISAAVVKQSPAIRSVPQLASMASGGGAVGQYGGMGPVTQGGSTAGGGVSYHSSPSNPLAQLSALMSSGPATYSSAPAPSAVPTTLVNSAPRGDDNINWLLNKVKTRADGPGVTDRAIDRAGSKIREFATGESERLKGRMARAGTMGTGVHEQGEAAISDNAQSNLAKAAADIEMGRERDIDQLLASTQGSFRAPAELSLAERGQNVSQYNTQSQIELQRQAQAQQQAMEQQRVLLAAIQSLY